ncbi:MAG TPA: tetratricopeptide repeat protein, partial [Pyrinomonadaceae bacterium]|nr:tetratricopeptide repeat protein [Pyrinomonadaceae bacterium]
MPVNLHGDILSSGNSDEITILGNEVTIKKMTSENGELLLYRRAKTLSDLTDDAIKTRLENETEAEQIAIKNIVKEFDGLPLALNLAGAYIHKFNKKFADYENLYNKSAHKLLEKQDINDQYQNDSVALAFSLAFETIAKPANESSEAKVIAQSAVSFLKTASFLNSKEIPRNILILMLYYQVELTEPILEFQLFLDEVYAKIAQFDLLKKDKDKNTFDIHHLVQLIINNKIETDEKQEIIEQILRVLFVIKPEYNYQNKESCEIYFRQTETALKNADKLSLENEFSKYLFNLLGNFQKQLGNYQLAEKFQFRSWKTSEKVYGKIHEETAQVLNDLSGIYSLQGRYDKAI